MMPLLLGRLSNKTNKSQNTIICNFYFFLKEKFRFEPRNIWDGCHDLIKSWINDFNNVTNVSFKGKVYQ